jgi:peptidoglycan/xylan/chitin deacetylase (PgdA/CDA1 family)
MVILSCEQKKQVCFSFDDLPVVDYGIKDSAFQTELMDRLIASVKKNHIPAIGFVNEKKLYDDRWRIPFQEELLNHWVKSGFDLGNHSYSHLDYNKVSLEVFSQDILKGETVSKEILGRNGKTIKYFRHPFLHVGNTKIKADSLSRFLSDHGYKEAPITIDNEDYLFAAAYQRAKVSRDKARTQQIVRDYIDYTERKLKYFEKQSNRLFGRNISHILLLHANWLNSDYIDSIAAIFRKNNYQFVSMSKALEDKAYETAITAYGNWGISWIDRWALSKGKTGEFFKDEPIIPEHIGKLVD